MRAEYEEYNDRRDYEEYGEDCHYCCGQGWGIIGVDWDSPDPINGPYDGESETCPCCGGSGRAEDSTFW